MRCNKLGLVAALLCAGTMAPAARAQQAGTYSGTSADGQNVSFVVGTDSNTGKLQITSFNLGITAPCHPGSYTYSTAWGVGGDGKDLTSHSTTYTYSFGYLYLVASMKFTSAGATGKITSYTPTFAPVNSGHPKKSVFCKSPQQGFTTTYAATSSVASAHSAATPLVGILYANGVSAK
jgi:hypothetical protein